jgi:hypothetical protein
METKTAKFTYHGNHVVAYTKTPDGFTATCDTCSLSHMTSMAVQFMVGHRVHSLVIDGAEIKRI